MDVNRIFKGFPKTPVQTNYDHPSRPPSIWKTRLEKFMYRADKAVGRRKLPLYILIALVTIAVVGSTGALLFSARTYKPVPVWANQTATARANQTATAQAYPYPAYPSYLPRNGTPVFFDSLSQEGEWHNELDPNGNTCQFTNGAYHIIQQKMRHFNHCDTTGNFSNFIFEVQLTIINGDCGGMVFRDDGNGQYYYFHICRDGTYKVDRFLNDSGKNLLSDKSSLINTGLGLQNKIAVVANGSTMTFYANGQSIGSKSDSNYASGSIGLIANPVFNDATEVAYTNARIWTL